MHTPGLMFLTNVESTFKYVDHHISFHLRESTSSPRMLFAGTVSGHIAVDEFEMITKMLLEWSNENGTRDVWFFHNVLVYHRDLKTNSWILLEAPSKMTDMTQLEQILLSS